MKPNNEHMKNELKSYLKHMSNHTNASESDIIPETNTITSNSNIHNNELQYSSF